MADFSKAIKRQDTVVNISNTSQVKGGEVGDTVNIDTVINLSSSQQEDITLVLPSISGNPETAYIRTLEEIENKQKFQTPYDPELLASLPVAEREKLEQRVEEIREEWKSIKEDSQNFSLQKVKLEKGSQELKFFMQDKITPVDSESGDQVYELSFVAPQSNFEITEGRFSMSVIIILPPGATLLEQSAINPNKGQPQPRLEYSKKEANVGRHLLQYSMQYDPIFTIKYKY